MKTKLFFVTSILFLGAFKANAQATQATNTVSNSNSYLGTSNNFDVIFKRQAIAAGLIATDRTSFGLNSVAMPNSLSIGTDAGNFSTGIGYNTYIGQNTGKNSIGGVNVFLGNSAGEAVTGSRNLFLGSYVGQSFTGSRNIVIGSNIAEGLIGNDNIIIGNDNERIGLNINNKLFIDTHEEGDNPLIWGDFATDQLKFNAKVGIGYGFGNYPTTAGGVNVSSYNLFVNGGILTEEVRVNAKTTWADYVFNKDYNLKPLAEVEKFIKENGYLPNVPSAAQVKEEGIALGEMAKIQQEKIEELTLYLIQQSKEIEELKAQVKSLLENK